MKCVLFLTLLVAIIAPTPSGWAGKPAFLRCSHKFLASNEDFVTTEDFIVYVKILARERQITARDLEIFLASLEQGKLINIVQNPSSKQSKQIHFDQFGYMIQESKEIDFVRLSLELKHLYDSSTSDTRQKKSTEDELIVPHYDIKFVTIPAGEYTITEGSTPRLIHIEHPFELMQTDLTQYQWFELMGADSSVFKDKNSAMLINHPAEHMTWYSAAELANRLSLKHGFTPVYDFSQVKFIAGTRPEDGTWAPEDARNAQSQMKILDSSGYRLISRDEWIWVASHFEDQKLDLKDYAWFNENSLGRTHEVMGKPPILIHGQKVYDIIGNVSKWNHDHPKNSASRTSTGASFHQMNLGLTAYSPTAADVQVGSVGIRLVRTLQSK